MVTLSPHDIMPIIQSGGTLLVSFGAGAWCPPCQMIKPMIKKASGMIGATQATIINCDEVQSFCQMFNIDGYPTVILFHKGARHIYDKGMQGSAEDLSTWVKTMLAGGGGGQQRISNNGRR